MDKPLITDEMLERYYLLDQQKKEIEAEMKQLKKTFHRYFDEEVGANQKGQVTNEKYKLQRQIRMTEKFQPEETVTRLETLNMKDLIKVEKIPDDEKIASAIQLGLLKEEDISDCKIRHNSKAISVKKIT